MFFCWDITILSNTPEEDPYEGWLRLPKGIITHVDVKYPAGCHGMVKVRMFKESLQLIPLTEDEWITGDDETVPTDTYAEMLNYPFKLKFIACSPDTIYAHTVTVRIEVHPEYAAGFAQITKLMSRLLDKLGFGNG